MEKITKDRLDEVLKNPPPENGRYIRVGMSSCGVAAGAAEVFALLRSEVEKRKLAVPVVPCGCSGGCHSEPLVEVCVDGLPSVTYGKVNAEIAMRIIEEHVRDKRLVQDYVVDAPVKRAVVL
jgi:NADP-reducing hydrogenase subunit HndB